MMAGSEFITRAISKAEQQKCCLTCAVCGDCDPSAAECGIKVKINELQRRRYHADIDRARAIRRKAAIPAAQYDKKKAYMREYYQRNRAAILAKEKARRS
jgi:recombinational DNA repair protein (RecF pathway)